MTGQIKFIPVTWDGDRYRTISETIESCHFAHFILHGVVSNVVDWRLLPESLGNLAEDCFSWEGVGLRYNYWTGGKDFVFSRSGTSMDEWISQYRSCVDTDGEMECRRKIPADPLFYFAQYFANFGRMQESRNQLSEAKAANFPLDWNSEGFLTWVGNLAAHAIFFPTNFGTSPGRAVVVIVGIFVLGVGYYWTESRRYNKDWKALRRVRGALVHREQQFASIAGRAELDGAGQRYEVDEAPSGTFKWRDGVGEMSPGDRSILTREDRELLRSRGLDEDEVLHITLIPGFMQYDRGRQPQKFSVWRFSLDATIPILDLHAYSSYYPLTRLGKRISMVQHMIGWWVLTSALGAIAIF